MITFRIKGRTFFDNDPPASPPPPPPPPTGIQFTPEQQAHVNKLLAENKRATQDENKRLATELQTLRDTANLTQQEKEALDIRIETLNSQHKTETERLSSQLESEKKKYKTDVDALANTSKQWQGNFFNLLIKNGVLAGAAQHNAADKTGQQLLMMLAPQAKVVEEVGDDGKPTGNFVAKLPVTVIGKDKKPTVVELPIDEAIGKMREDERHANLFLIDGKPGLGGQGGVGGRGTGQKDWSKMTPKEHREARKNL